MNYYDTNTVEDEFVGVYARVSTANQNLSQQITLAKAFITNSQIDIKKVHWFKDNDVSANKLSLEQRPALHNLRILIKQNKIKTVIVYSRDRLARNFYEYVSLIKEFYKYKVNVIFTANTQPPFQKFLHLEALYGIFGQTEGKSIVGRTHDSNKQYPSRIFGFKRVIENKEVTFKPDSKVSEVLKSFFYSIINSESTQDFFEVLMKYKKVFKSKSFEDLLRYLQNPFYSGKLNTQNGYIDLRHVEPIISFDNHLAIQKILKVRKDEILSAINASMNKGVLTPICSYCKTSMRFRSSALGESGFYICKKKHPEIKITVSELNRLIFNQLTNIIQQLPLQSIKREIFSHLIDLEKKYLQKRESLERKLSKVHKNITEHYGSLNKEKMKFLVESSRTIKEELEEINISLIKITESRSDINELVKSVKICLENEIQSYNQFFLIQLFFSKVEINDESMIYHITFGKFINESSEEYAHKP